MSDIKFTIDGKECTAKSGQTIVEAAKANGIYIPVLCHFEGLKPAGTCRICTVKVGGRFMAGCTTPVAAGMRIDNMTPEIEDMRKQIIEMLFVEGNHMCPVCEKSGNCELQALAYRYKMMVPRFPFLWPQREVVANTPKLYLDKNRCVQCLRCVREIVTEDGKHVFAVKDRGGKTTINMDEKLAAGLSDEMAMRAMDICPVGCIIRKEVGYKVPIGQRKFDSKPIGSEIEGR
ncbi:MAG TPA: 2Fe-2S iron-sulfur cluster-binding protein [Spirochaetota bacterium]|nr:2Fe-2S iron-sulfur cluster-binding protein [Spirochaetota bacterium]HPF05595.1 2Fe-2S iron-sulfur cluster-binding protein [Spirochaetota bacterium]HPJ43559.1 2Fe-2S iron-sulfur cluster-binding protein [Spirochaetota bacterium]HPR36533.1 2Fe-2S iron-sulfur cluster-binding protein [Spirochaetota bacterium]HRX47032.1 2Fe-2S iron-sulfur cluster-binding protein [Spirochaetota bacterium]